jgi:hypothetical protein
MLIPSLSVAILFLSQPPDLSAKVQVNPAISANDIPRHYSHIRLAALGYSGLRIGSLENRLLRDSFDVVVVNSQLLKHASEVAPNTPRLIYTNCSNVYENLLLDWLSWADSQGISREFAFYHASTPTPFQGDSPSSRPVSWFWHAYRGGSRPHEVTPEITGSKSRFQMPAVGESLYLGYPERFAEVQIRLVDGANADYSGIWEWLAGTDPTSPEAWLPLTLTRDETSGLRGSGAIHFDPPKNWKAASFQAKDRLFYIRFRCLDGRPPFAVSILGRDYVSSDGKRNRGIVPVFDAQADSNHDGYLDDAEYARRAPGKDARFAYESRLFTDYYGPMRFATNIGTAECRRWIIDYHRREKELHAGATGYFMDNSLGKPPLKPAGVAESMAGYGADYGRLIAEIGRAISPWWIIPNTAGGNKLADEVVKRYPVYFEEFMLRPLSHNFNMFEEMAAVVERRSKLTSPAPLAFLDTHPQRADRSKADPLDPRTQLSALAYFYLVADADRTFLLFFAGFEPATAWQRHWCEAASHDVGRAKNRWSLFAKGSDPSDSRREFRIYAREYEQALILYKPVSYQKGVYTPVPIGDETATVHKLPTAYRLLAADGKPGDATTEIRLRNGEGAILINARSE